MIYLYVFGLVNKLLIDKVADIGRGSSTSLVCSCPVVLQRRDKPTGAEFATGPTRTILASGRPFHLSLGAGFSRVRARVKETNFGNSDGESRRWRQFAKTNPVASPDCFATLAVARGGELNNNEELERSQGRGSPRTNA